SPDLLLLDIKMPVLDGFAVVEGIKTEPRPTVIFVTGYDQYALRAFDAHAVDYLLKPVARERFQLALRRALEQIKNRQPGGRDVTTWAPARSSVGDGVQTIAQHSRARPFEPIAVKSGTRITLLKRADIVWVQSGHNYIEIHTHKQSHIVRETMAAIEYRLPPE